MRIASTQMVGNYLKQLNKSYNSQSKLMEQSDGSKLHRPSDDSVGYSKYLRYQISDNENSQYQTNVKTAISWMENSDSAMINMKDILTTINGKAQAAANETNTTSDLQSIAKEVYAELQELVSLGNTQVGDRYLFAGQSDTTEPFTLSTTKVQRGDTYTLSEKQSGFFSDADSSGSLTQLLKLNGSDGSNYYLNTTNGKVYSEDFVKSGYVDKISAGQTTVADGDEVGTISGFAKDGGATVSDYFENTGKINAAGEGASFSISVDGSDVDLTFATVEQNIVSYAGDLKYISMVKQNGSIDPSADTVNVTGQDLFGTDIFDDANSGNTASGSAALNNLLNMYEKLNTGDIHWMGEQGVTIASQTHYTVVNAETKMAARQNVYSEVSSMLTTQSETITSDINDVSGTDVAELAVKLMEAQTIYNLALSVGGRILPSSLADYLS